MEWAHGPMSYSQTDFSQGKLGVQRERHGGRKKKKSLFLKNISALLSRVSIVIFTYQPHVDCRFVLVSDVMQQQMRKRTIMTQGPYKQVVNTTLAYIWFADAELVIEQFEAKIIIHVYGLLVNLSLTFTQLLVPPVHFHRIREEWHSGQQRENVPGLTLLVGCFLSKAILLD